MAYADRPPEVMGHDLFGGGKGVVGTTGGGPFLIIEPYWRETPAVHWILLCLL